MIRFAVYFFPALINCITGMIFFTSSASFSDAGCSGFEVGATMAVWAIVYSLVSYGIGFFVTKGNAPFLVSCGAFALAVASVMYLLFPDALYLQYAFIALAGAGGAIYCTPFQVFMKSLEPDGGEGVGAVRAASLYEISWSVGIGTGPFLFAVLDRAAGFMAMTVAGLAVSVFVLVLRKYSSGGAIMEDHSAVRKIGVTTGKDYSGAPDLAFTGWVVGGVGTFTISIIRSLEPFRGEIMKFDVQAIAFALALVSYVQALVAFLLIRSKDWMFSSSRAGLMGLSGIVGLLFFGLGTHVWSFFAGAVFYGVFSGCFYFVLVFHSIIHPTKSSRYLAMNEMVVGIAGTGGPLLGGLIAGTTSGNTVFSSFPFILSAVLVCFSTLYHVLKLRKIREVF